MDNRYYSLNTYFRELFSDKVYKISLNGGMTCPNRDGTLGYNGCIFCSEGGSGEFAGSAAYSITEQINAGMALVQNKSSSHKYLAYFQAFTNTYAPASYLKELYMEALRHPAVVGLSIGTRPDCLPEDVIELLAECRQYKPVFIELGLQTIHEETARFIRRGYALPCFEDACNHLYAHKIPVVVHLILGLPGETREQMLCSIRYLNHMPIHGIKLSLLHILKHTDLAAYYEAHPFPVPTLTEYIDLLIDCLEHLRPDIVVHRITGDGPKNLLIAPQWTGNKKLVLNSIVKEMKIRNSYQGKKYEE